MKNEVKTWYNYSGPKKEKFTLPSLTVPDQTLSLHDLISRYVRGQEVPVYQPVFLDEDSPVPPGLENMTVQDRIDLARELKENIVGRRAAMRKEPAPAPAPAPGTPPEDVEGS